MFFCPLCNQEVGLLFARHINEMGEKRVAELVQQQEKEGVLLYLCAPEQGPWKCPQCGTTLEDI